MFQKDVARLLGVATDTVTNWEKNRVQPCLRTLPHVFEFLGYDPRPSGQNIGEQIVSIRKARGLSQKELAQVLKVDPGTLSKWERDACEPQGLNLERASRFLNENC